VKAAKTILGVGLLCVLFWAGWQGVEYLFHAATGSSLTLSQIGDIIEWYWMWGFAVIAAILIPISVVRGILERRRQS
jgi:hypothetical protein